MPVVGPSFQAHPAQNSQIAMAYPGFGNALHPNGQHVPTNNHGAMITPPQFAGAPGPGYVINNTNNGPNAIPLNGPVVGMTLHDQAEAARMAQDYEALVNIIKQWNANRLDLFALTLPNEMLEFHGVMRFYYQSHDMATGQKVATKCIRVSSTATTKVIIETLIEKFRPDMKMLEVPEYALYEIHESGERRLGLEEKPLLVQLNWHKDDREGRFLLRRIDEATQMAHLTNQSSSNSQSGSLNGGKGSGKEHEIAVNSGGLSPNATGTGEFKRKLSKREKKELKKQEKLNKVKNKENNNKGIGAQNEEGVAEKLYTEFPDTSFTRSISNPEAVMRRRRQQKLEKKLQQFRSKDGGPDTGGTLKIYGEALCKDVPYKTLLLSVHDSAAFVVEEMLDKYGIDRKEASHFCLVQSTTIPPQAHNGQTKGTDQIDSNPVSREYYLDDDECPLAILMNHSMNPARGSITFHVKKRPADSHLRKRKKKPGQHPYEANSQAMYHDNPRMNTGPPYLLEMNPDGSEINHAHQNVMPQRFRLSPNVTEVGSDPAIQSGQSLLLPPAQFLHPRHCVITYTDGIVTVTPIHREAETYINNQRIYETTILGHGSVLRFGRPGHCFRFIDPNVIAHQEQSRMLQQTEIALNPAIGADSTGLSSQSNYVHYGPSRLNQSQSNIMGRDNILPAVLEFREETEEAFFNAITVSLEVNAVHFKLAPTYTIYMATRFRASTHYRPELIPEERAIRLTEMLNGVAERIFATIEERGRDAPVLAFWMANASELLHFLKSDRHITSFSHQAQDILAEAIHLAFKQLVVCLQSDLEMTMPNILLDIDDDQGGGELGGQATSGTMNVLSSAMSLLRKCRVNAALTIQLFSQLFHFINMWTFNQIVSVNANESNEHSQKPNFCTHRWGLRLKKRLSRVENWAEKQGLELAADCHLARVVQAAHLLLARKNTAEDIASVSSICFKLNSVQLKNLLDRYEPAPDENPISKEMIDTIVRVAENTVDEVTNSEGREVRLEEDYVLQLPFLLPEDGYSCDIVRGVPGGLNDFIIPLQRVGLCVMTPQPTSSGFWTIYMDSSIIATGQESITPTPSEMSQNSAMVNGSNPQQLGPHVQGMNEPEVQCIQLVKSNSGMGLSIVAAKGVGKDRLGIYIKAVVEGGAAFHDGRLAAGDQLLRVDGQSLVGITQEKAAEIMMHTGQIVELEVAKQGAIYHGLATLLSQPSPVMSPRGIASGPPPQVHGHPNGQIRRISEREMPHQHTKVTQSKSMNALHSPQNLQNDQHTYQNHRPSFPIPSSQKPIQQLHNQASTMRSTSIHNLVSKSQASDLETTSSNTIGTRQASQPVLGNGIPPDSTHQNYTNHELDQSYYQNVGPNGQPQQQLQQHMPLRYHQQKFGSQTSLQQRNQEANQRPPSLSNYTMYPSNQPNGSNTDNRFPHIDEIHHASPRIIGTPMSSSSSPLKNSNSNQLVKPPDATPSGPEKPLRQHSYHEETQPNVNERSNKLSSTSRVRFQDIDSNEGDDQTNKIELQLENLRLSSVEREFRKRIAEYNTGNGMNGNGDSGSDSEDRRRLPPSTGNGNILHGTHPSFAKMSNSNKFDQDRNRKMETVERKQQELAETNLAEERILSHAKSRNAFDAINSQTPTPPPLPESLPPGDVVNDNIHNQSQLQSGAARLDLLVGGVTQTGGSPQRVDTSFKNESKEGHQTKRVSFVTSTENMANDRKVSNDGFEDEQKRGKNDDKLYRLERAEEQGPNAFISEAEALLNSSSLALDSSRHEFNKSTGYTPSVIGAQEVYRDPRQKRLQKAEDEKADKNKRDGAKLSFQEKMKLFAVEAGEKTPNRDKAKISRAQRELEDEESSSDFHGQELSND